MINKRTLAWGVSLMFVLGSAVSFHLYGMQKRGIGVQSKASIIEQNIRQAKKIAQSNPNKAIDILEQIERETKTLPAQEASTINTAIKETAQLVDTSKLNQQNKKSLERMMGGSGKPKDEKEPKDWKEVRKQAKATAKDAVNLADGKKYEKGDALYDDAIKAQNEAVNANDLNTAKAAKKAAKAALAAAQSAPQKPPKDLGDSEAVQKAKAAVAALEGKILGAGKLVTFITQTLPGNANFIANKNGVQGNANYKDLKNLVDRYLNNVQGKPINDANAAEIKASAEAIEGDFDAIYDNKKAAIEALIKDDVVKIDVDSLSNMTSDEIKKMEQDEKTKIYNQLDDMINNLNENDPDYDNKYEELDNIKVKFNPVKL